MDEIGMNNFKATIFKALGDPSRLRILEYLRLGEKCVCSIVPTVGSTQPTVSRHLKVLTDCGILKRRRVGNRILYSVTSTKIYDVIDSLDSRLIESFSRHIITSIQSGRR
ncbi:winged helix-turn-helix transcriptional regulator [Candidatus Bathyarchaeota archaeon]|nr:winged helix-turn-helix transcriptional regulator [Candidatus Bathyarchaeota archaeon]